MSDFITSETTAAEFLANVEVSAPTSKRIRNKRGGKSKAPVAEVIATEAPATEAPAIEAPAPFVTPLTAGSTVVAKSARYAAVLIADRNKFQSELHFKKGTAKAVIYQALLDAKETDSFIALPQLHALCVENAKCRADRTLASFVSDISDVAVRINRKIESRKNAEGIREYRIA